MEKVLEPCDSMAVPLTPSLNAFMIDVSGLLFLMSLLILPLHLFPAPPPSQPGPTSGFFLLRFFSPPLFLVQGWDGGLL